MRIDCSQPQLGQIYQVQDVGNDVEHCSADAGTDTRPLRKCDQGLRLTKDLEELARWYWQLFEDTEKKKCC